MSNHVRGASTPSRPDPNAAVRRELAREHRISGPLPVLMVLALALAGIAGVAGATSQLGGQDGSLAASHSATTYQDTSSALHWSAGWKLVRTGSASGGTERATGKAGATMTLSYNGTRVQIIGPTRSAGGTIQVTLDGSSTSVSTHAGSFHAHQVLYTANPANGHHTLTIRFMSTAKHRYFALDSLLVTAIAPAIVVSNPTPTPTAPADPTPTPTSGGPFPTPTMTPDPTPKPTSAPKPTAAPQTPSGPGYGMGIGADSLANMQVGGTLCQCSNRLTSYRFQATTSSKLDSARVYLASGSGYSGGNGGTISISVQTDDGSSLHAPSGTVLASTSIKPGNPTTAFHTIAFSSPAILVAGQLYHLVFKNVDAKPTVNYVSVDDLFTYAVSTPRQQAYSDVNWGQLMNDGRGWMTSANYTPIVDLGYSNGVHAGVGYMEVWVNAPRTIGGSSAVRETFTPASNHTVSAVSVRVSRKSGSSPLTVKLETSGGSVLATGSISAAAVGSNPSWVSTSLSSTVTMSAGTGYLLVLSAPSGNAYSAFSIERGNNYQFASSTYFSEGYGQYTTGSSWSGFDQPGGSSNNKNADMQFYFH